MCNPSQGQTRSQRMVALTTWKHLERKMRQMKPYLLRAERRQLGLSQIKLAKILGVHPRTVRRWELGQTVPYPYYRRQLSILFGKTIQQLSLLCDLDEDEAVEA